MNTNLVRPKLQVVVNHWYGMLLGPAGSFMAGIPAYGMKKRRWWTKSIIPEVDGSSSNNDKMLMELLGYNEYHIFGW